MTSPILAKLPKLTSLQALRGLAFLGVFFEHTLLCQTGAWGVSVFFVLSGFLMIYTYYDRPVKTGLKSGFQFAYKKTCKLYPLHILTLIAAIPLYNWAAAGSQFWGNIFSNLLLLQSWSGNASTYFSFNAVSWYLSTCVLLYFCFPFIHKAIMKYSSKNSAYLGILVTFLLQTALAYGVSFAPEANAFSDSFSKWFTYIFPVFRLGDFIIGCNLGYLFLHRGKAPLKAITALSELLTFLLIAASLYAYDARLGLGDFEWSRYTLLYTPTSILLVYLFAQNSGYLTKLLANKLLVHIGNISPYAFLIHAIIIRYVNKAFLTINGYTLTPWKLTLLTLILVWLASLLIIKLEKMLQKHLTILRKPS